MAKVSDIIVCMNATNTEGVGVSAINILPAITPEYVPGLFTFSVVAIVLDLDLTKNHSLRVDFKDPEGEIVVHVEGVLPSQEIHSNLPSEQLGVNIAMDWNNVNFKRGGLFTIEVIIDEELLGEKQIFVKGKNE